MDRLLIREALRHLKAADRVFSPLIKKHGPCTITPAVNNPFHALASSIISQQLSVHAARTIKGRLFHLLGEDSFTPANILRISARDLHAAGLSGAKTGYIRGLAAAFKNGEFDFAAIAKYGDEEAVAQLMVFAGIGRWTAEMFLIFGLGRPDVLSVHDAGLRRAIKMLYDLKEMPAAAEMMVIGEPWRPYRSVASWYLWRAADG